MPCCCFPFNRSRKVSAHSENIFDDLIRMKISNNFNSPCTCKPPVNSNSCTCKILNPQVATSLKKSNSDRLVRKNASLDFTEKIPSSSTQSYKTAKSFVYTEEESLGIDYTEDTYDDINEPRFSIDAVEASELVLSDYSYTKFYDTIRDSPLKYQDISGQSQSMRRYSSAVADRSSVLIERSEPLEFDFEPLNLSCQYSEEYHNSKRQVSECTPMQESKDSGMKDGYYEIDGELRMVESENNIRRSVPFIQILLVNNLTR